MNDARQLVLIPEPERPRACVINGEPHISILDAYRIYGNSKNPTTDWRRDQRELERQGYDLADLIHHQFPDSSGKLNRSTPVANEEQLARIAQVARFPEWEPLRQEMARLLVQARRGKRAQLPFQHTPKYRELREAGYTHAQALEWHDRDTIGVEARKQAVQEWHQRHGDIAYLTNHVTRLVSGKSATRLKKELGIKVSPRAYMSSVKKTALSLVEGIGTTIHRRRDSEGTAELTQDLSDAAGVIDWNKLTEMFPDTPLPPPLPRPEQRRLLPPSGSYTPAEEAR